MPKSRTILFVVFSIVVSVSLGSFSFADTAVRESTLQIDANGTGSAYYSDPNYGGSTNASLDGVDLGTFDPSMGDTLELENFYFKNDAWDTSGGASSMNNNWIDPSSNSATYNLTISGATTSTTMNFTGDAGAIKFWDLGSGAGIDLLAGLSAGVYTLTYTADYEYNYWNGTAAQELTTTYNPGVSATFEIVPEPAGFMLAGLAGLLLAVRRAHA